MFTRLVISRLFMCSSLGSGGCARELYFGKLGIKVCHREPSTGSGGFTSAWSRFGSVGSCSGKRDTWGHRGHPDSAGTNPWDFHRDPPARPQSIPQKAIQGFSEEMLVCRAPQTFQGMRKTSRNPRNSAALLGQDQREM